MCVTLFGCHTLSMAEEIAVGKGKSQTKGLELDMVICSVYLPES